MKYIHTHTYVCISVENHHQQQRKQTNKYYSDNGVHPLLPLDEETQKPINTHSLTHLFFFLFFVVQRSMRKATTATNQKPQRKEEML